MSRTSLNCADVFQMNYGLKYMVSSGTDLNLFIDVKPF